MTDALTTGSLAESLGLPHINVEDDCYMLCGSPSMLKGFCETLYERGFNESIRGNVVEYVIERVFVES